MVIRQEDMARLSDKRTWPWLSDKRVTNLLSLAEGFTVQQLPPAVHSDSIFWVSAICGMASAKCY